MSTLHSVAAIAVALGSCGCAWSQAPVSGADSIPFVVGSYADALRMRQLQRPGIQRAAAMQNLKVLYSQKPISTEADFRGSHMRTYNASTLRIAELLGAKPVDVPMVEVAKALAEGRMDSMITSSVTGAENKVWSHINNYSEINAWVKKFSREWVRSVGNDANALFIPFYVQ